MLAGAYAFQYIGGLAPCQMCHWQRWTHWAVLAAALFALALPRIAALRWLVAIALGAGVTVATFHAGVEYGWWQGPATCSAGMIDPEDLRAGGSVFDLDAPISAATCSDPAWVMLGISMAGWNAIMTLLALLAFAWLTTKVRYAWK